MQRHSPHHYKTKGLRCSKTHEMMLPLSFVCRTIYKMLRYSVLHKRRDDKSNVHDFILYFVLIIFANEEKTPTYAHHCAPHGDSRTAFHHSRSCKPNSFRA